MAIDPDIATFLEESRAFMNIDALQRDWERYFVDGIAEMTDEPLKRAFKRGFAKAVLGQLSADDYENATGWDFDTEDEFCAHLIKYWHIFYGDDEPEDVLAATED